VRETDGLAMSSRNRYLNAAQRELAGVLSAALLAGTYAAARGADAALQAAGAVLAEVPAIDVDYLEVRDSALGSAPASGAGRLLVAARLGKTRLLDNVAIEIGTTVGADGRVSAVSAEYRPATMRAGHRPEVGALPREREVPPPACGGEPGNQVLETPWRN